MRLAVFTPDGYTSGMIVLTNTGGVAMTNCFLIADETARQAVLFDAPDHTVAPLLEAATARGWELTELWLTHGHFDHFADHAVVRQKFPGVRILLHALDQPKARQPEAQTRLFASAGYPPLVADAGLTDNQSLKSVAGGGGSPYSRHSPGHVATTFRRNNCWSAAIRSSAARSPHHPPDSDPRQQASVAGS